MTMMYSFISTYKTIFKNKQVLARMCTNWNLQALMVGRQNGAAAMENSLSVPQMVKHGVITWPHSLVPRYIAKRIGNICSFKNLSINIHSSKIHSS
jgi:hypothetical protein